MKDYDHKKIEPKWQKYWESKKLNRATENSKKKKFFSLIEFPYPSGDGLHVGHIRSNTAMDIISRKRRAEGYEVLYPIGWDAFGLPTENYAIKTGIHPIAVTKKNTDTFRKQLKALGFSFDWSREINTTDPAYYKWTQWIFLKFLEKGLAYKKKMAINWCPKDKIGLANEEVVDGCCERCGTAVEKREKEQWMLAITKYADRLDRDLGAKKILVGTRNPAKVKMIKACMAGVPGIELLSLDDIPAVDDSELHEGDDFLENAKMKAEFYFKKTGIPTIATDHILWIEKWPENNGFMVHVRKHANPNSPRATDDELIAFLKKFLKTVGGTSKANFHYGFAYADEAGTIVADEVPGNYILQDKEQAKKYWPGYPTEALLKDAETGVFKADQPDDVRYKKIIVFLQKKFVTRMLAGSGGVDYLEKIKIQQKNWIGKSEGAEIGFRVQPARTYQSTLGTGGGSGFSGEVKVFTTRPDTLFGVTYLVLAPEHPLVRNNELRITNYEEVKKYAVEAKNKTEIERADTAKEKTGVELKGIKAINPANNEEIPICVADYVLGDYGTGAIMAVPAHDERDFEFAKKYNLPITNVIEPVFVDKIEPNLPFVERRAISAVVRHWSEDKYIVLKWKKADWVTFVTGGVEDGEDPTSAAIREIQEETGYQNLKLVKILPPSHSKFYHIPKKQNHFAHFSNFYFQLIDGECKELSNEEKENHEIVWATKEEIQKILTPEGEIRDLDIIIGGEKVYTGAGVLVNSGKFDGRDSEQTKKEIVRFVGGKIVTTYKLRDWIFSRQRYWGEPIPVVHCEKCGIVPVPEKDLPVKLPNVKNYKPTDTGESPLASISKWVNVKCPKCKGKARRETDTMPNWAGSSWYYLRYVDPKNKKAFADAKTLKYWTPVDWYNGGMEHTTLHLLYSRFWHKFLFDCGLVPTSEPYIKRTSHGLILGEGGVKMSKSLGNVVNPDALIKTFGADTLRLYEMFMGPFDQHIAWSTESMVGPRRFLERVWKFAERFVGKKQKTETRESALLHRTIKKVGEDIEAMRFNTASSALMILLNEFEKTPDISQAQYEIFLKLLAPFTPHITDELWSLLGHSKSIHLESWPVYDKKLSEQGSGVLVIQVNGKVRANLEISGEPSEADVTKQALALDDIKKWVTAPVKKIIYVKGRLLNIVV